MSNLIKVTDFELVEGKKISNKSFIIKEAFRRLRAKNRFHEEEFEDVIDPYELLLECYNSAKGKKQLYTLKSKTCTKKINYKDGTYSVTDYSGAIIKKNEVSVFVDMINKCIKRKDNTNAN